MLAGGRRAEGASVGEGGEVPSPRVFPGGASGGSGAGERKGGRSREGLMVPDGNRPKLFLTSPGLDRPKGGSPPAFQASQLPSPLLSCFSFPASQGGRRGPRASGSVSEKLEWAQSG